MIIIIRIGSTTWTFRLSLDFAWVKNVQTHIFLSTISKQQFGNARVGALRNWSETQRSSCSVFYFYCCQPVKQLTPCFVALLQAVLVISAISI